MQNSIYYSPQRVNLRSDAESKSVKKNGEINLGTVGLKEFEINHGKVLAVLSLVIVVVGGFYLLNFNKNMTKGYELQKLHIERDKLNKERDVINMNIAKVGSFTQMLDDSSLVGMVKANNVEYILPDGHFFAAK